MAGSVHSYKIENLTEHALNKVRVTHQIIK